MIRPAFRTFAAVNLVVAAGLAPPSGAGMTAKAATSVFAPFTGTFRGSGTIRRGPDEPAETVRCRITSKLSADGQSLHQTGTCAVPGSKAAIDSRIKLNPATGRLTGSWTDVANGARAGVTGRISGKTVHLTIVGKDTQTGENRTFWMVLEPDSAGYQMTSTTPDARSGRKFTSGKIRFKK